MAKARDDAGGRDIRDVTRNLVESVLLDVWPRNAAIVDFGLKTQEHYEALYHPLRHGDITPEQVDAALGNGRKLTELVNTAPHNPHKGIEFRTDWDDLRPEPGHQGDGTPPLPSSGKPAAGSPHLWPSEIAKANRQKPAGEDRDKSNGRVQGDGHNDGHSM